MNSKLTSVAISANGGKVVAGCEDGTVQVWNLNDRDSMPKPVGQPHQGRVTSVALSRDGSQLASSGGDGFIDLSKPEGTHRRLDTGGGIFSVAFDPAGDKLAAGGADGAIRVWTIGKVPPAGGNVPADSTVPNAHAGGVMSIAFSPTDPVIASGGADNTVRFWDSDTLTPLERPLTTLTGQGHTAPVASVAFSADGRRVVSGSNDETVQLWDVGQRKRIGDPMVGHQGLVLSVTFLGNDKIVSGGNDRALRFWNGVVGQPISEPLTGHGGPVTSVAITTDGRRIASASVDGTVWLWDSDTGTKISEMPEPAGVVSRVAFNSVAFNWSGDMVASGSADGKIRLWQWKNNTVTTFDTGRPVTAVALNPAGDRLVFGGMDGQITLCELPSGRQTPLENRDHAMIFAVAFDPHGERFVSGGISGIVREWDLAARQLWESDAGTYLPQTFSDKLLLADGHPGAVLSVAFSPDGRQVLSGSADWTASGDTAGVVRRWNADKGTPLGDPAQVGRNGMAIMGLAFSPQSPGATGDRIFGGSFYPYNVELWNPGNGDLFSFPLRHNAPVVSVAVSADGSRIVSGSADQTVRIWPNPPPIPAADALCAKLTTTMNEKHWHEWVSPTIPYADHLCAGLPPTPDENPS